MERSDEPKTPLGFIVNEAIELIERLCEEGAVEQPRGIITLVAASVPGSRHDSEIAGFGFDDASEMVTDLIVHLSAAAEAFGFKIQIHPLHGGPAS